MDVRPTDRVLLLRFETVDEVQAIAERVSSGMVVGVTEGDGVYEARRALQDFTNVMIIPAEPHGTLPWKDDFFTVVSAPRAHGPSEEMLRVLEPGGTLWVSGGPIVKR